MNSNKIKKAGMKTSRRVAQTKGQVNDLIVYEYLTTTKARSELVLKEFSRIMKILKSPKSEFERRRLLKKASMRENTINKLFDVYVERFKDLNSGYVRQYRLGTRPGDRAELVKLMMKGYEYKELGKKTAKKEKKEKEEKKEQSLGNVQTKDTKKSQLEGNITSSKAKTRSGI